MHFVPTLLSLLERNADHTYLIISFFSLFISLFPFFLSFNSFSKPFALLECLFFFVLVPVVEVAVELGCPSSSSVSSLMFCVV